MFEGFSALSIVFSSYIRVRSLSDSQNLLFFLFVVWVHLYGEASGSMTSVQYTSGYTMSAQYTGIHLSNHSSLKHSSVLDLREGGAGRDTSGVGSTNPERKRPANSAILIILQFDYLSNRPSSPSVLTERTRSSIRQPHSDVWDVRRTLNVSALRDNLQEKSFIHR